MPVIGSSTGIKSTPLGFWIWCAAEAAPPSHGGDQNFGACQGSMYFFNLEKHASPIVGFIQEIPEDSGKYTMFVAEGTFGEIVTGKFDPAKSAFLCTLNNPEVKLTHTVNVACQFGQELGGGVGAPTLVTNSI